MNLSDNDNSNNPDLKLDTTGVNFREIDIHRLLPQREPFVMIGALVHFDMEKTVTETVISADNIFTENGVFTPAGMIENIAQTCAARIGYINLNLNKDIVVGFIGAIRNMKIYRCPRVGELITTTIITIEEIFGMTLVKATIFCGDELLAESEMKIALGNQAPPQG